MTTDTWTQTRSEIANLSKTLDRDDPRLTELRGKLRAQRLAEHVAEIVGGWPKLTDTQLDDIVAILRAGGAS